MTVKSLDTAKCLTLLDSFLTSTIAKEPQIITSNKKVKILNLYAGLGGNRKLWPSDKIEVTAVEYEPPIAEAYKKFFPNDRVIVGDAHSYLMEHFSEYDFIWTSPPCPTHSVMGFLAMKIDIKRKKTKEKNRGGNKKPEYPDMKLYQEIVFLKHFFEGKWVVENTKSYYDPLIEPYISGNHFLWSNFHITDIECRGRSVSVSDLKEKQKRSGFNIDGMDFNKISCTHKKDKVLNNCTEPSLGLHVFNCAFRFEQSTLEAVIS